MVLLLLLNINVPVLVSGHGGLASEDDHDDDGDADSPRGQKLLVISLDGFRYDFLDIHKTATLTKLSAEGVRAQSLTSSYATKTFPNHISIVTGLYEESHGIVANTMYDPLWNETFHYCAGDKSCGKWYGGKPIWNVNELNNNLAVHHGNVSKWSRFRRHGGDAAHKEQEGTMRASGVVYWPGIGAQINDMNVTFMENFKTPNQAGYLNFRERLDKILSWFLHDSTPINLGLVYNEYPDQLCHKYGPESKEVCKSFGVSPMVSVISCLIM